MEVRRKRRTGSESEIRTDPISDSSGITAGCAGGNYCPDAPLTRRQMAVFLAKALGLQWTNY